MTKKIIIVAPKTISKNSPYRFDYSFWNFYLPLKNLGYDVEFCDTSVEGDVELSNRISSLSPDLLFCIMTGDKNYCPNEPWKTLQEVKTSRGIKTFNWFCDDTWRFDQFSSKVCHIFDVCSTTRKDSLEEYRKIGYNKVFLTNWHANDNLYGSPTTNKQVDITFIGGLHGQRKSYIDYLEKNGLSINNPKNCSFEEMLWEYGRSKICLNFARCSVGNKNQMKARLFEVVASNSLLMTQKSPNIEDYFLEDKEAVFFSNPKELYEKLSFLLKKPEILNKISNAGYNRYTKEHTSEKRLSKVIETINNMVHHD